MSKKKITLFYEVLTAIGANQEEELDAPDDWDTMTGDQRREWCDEAWRDGLQNVVSGSYTCDGEEV